MSTKGETDDFENDEGKGNPVASPENVTSENQKLRIELERVSAELSPKNRELEVEAALDKVRSRALAMLQSQEISEVVLTVYRQLNELGFNLRDGAVAILEFEEGSRDHTQWIVDLYHTYPTAFRMPYSDHLVNSELFRARESGLDYFSGLFPFKEKNALFRHLFSQNPDYKDLPEEVKNFLLNSRDYGISVAFSKHSGILIPTNTGKLLDNEQKDILIRFSRVFDQAYTRFLDLQKAEAQAREAQIEAALERVRSRLMGMKKSNELKEVVMEVFSNMKELGFFQNNSVMIVLPKNGFKDTLHWTFNENFETTEYFIPAFNHQVSIGAYETWKNGHKIFEINLDKVEKDKFLDLIFTETDYAKVPAEFKNFLYSTEAYSQILVFEEHCGLLVDTFSTVKYSTSQKDVITRFSSVFEQAYTRFLDLQKAEAQVREAQIEAALEKVRSRSLAMHYSSELEQVVGSLFDRLVDLQLSFDGAGIYLFDKEKRDISLWIATTQLAAPALIDLPFDNEIENNQLWKDLWKAFETGTDIFQCNYTGEAKNEYFRYVARHNPIPEPVKKIHQEKDWLANMVARKYALIGYDS